MYVQTLQPTQVYENDPPQMPSYLSASRLDITSFTGGLVTSLDALSTKYRTLRSVLTIQPNGPGTQLIRVQLVETTLPAELGYRITPLDYDAVTNPRQWEVVG